MYLRKVIIKHPVTNLSRKGCLLLIPGRGLPASSFINWAKVMRLSRTVVAAVESVRLSWYPMPNGADDQDAAVNGLPYGVQSAKDGVDQICRACNLEYKDVVLMGFSAGAVIALQLAMNAEKPFAACIALAGAILEPNKIKAATNQCPYVLQHNKDDYCFKWEERYLPMKKALLQNGYNVKVLEGYYGGHMPSNYDGICISKFIHPLLGYNKNFIKKFQQTL